MKHEGSSEPMLEGLLKGTMGTSRRPIADAVEGRKALKRRIDRDKML
jgi:hypothetical protein